MNGKTPEVYIGPEPHIEVHKYICGVVPAVVVLALVLQAFFPVRWSGYLELPLLVTLYVRTQQTQSIVGLGARHGDWTFAGQSEPHATRLYGIAKTLVWIVGSRSRRLDVEHPARPLHF